MKCPFKKKIEVFSAAVRSVICDSSKEWGHQNFEEVEKLGIFFIKDCSRFQFIPIDI